MGDGEKLKLGKLKVEMGDPLAPTTSAASRQFKFKLEIEGGRWGKVESRK